MAAPTPVRRIVRAAPKAADEGTNIRRVVRAVDRAKPPTNAATETEVAATEADAKIVRAPKTKAQADQAQVAARAKAKGAPQPKVGRRSQYAPGVCHHRDPKTGEPDCDKPLIRATALCCAEHEIEYREAAKARKAARDGGAPKAAKAAKPAKAAPAPKVEKAAPAKPAARPVARVVRRKS